jgi:hypothetical protein
MGLSHNLLIGTKAALTLIKSLASSIREIGKGLRHK